MPGSRIKEVRMNLPTIWKRPTTSALNTISAAGRTTLDRRFCKI